MSDLFTDLDNSASKIVPPNIELKQEQMQAPWERGAYLATDTGVGQFAPSMLRYGQRPQWLQGCLGWNGAILMVPSSSSNVPQGIGCTLTSALSSGSLSHPAMAASPLFASARRTKLAATGVGGGRAEVYSQQTIAWRGTPGGYGGFYFSTRFALQIATTPTGGDPPPNQFGFVGLQAAITAIGGTSPINNPNQLGIGADGTSANLGIYYNDTTATSGREDLGTNYAIDGENGSKFIQFEMFCKPAGDTVYFRVQRLDSPLIAPRLFKSKVQVPSLNIFLAFHAYVNNGTVGGNPSLHLVRTYVESDI